VTRDGDPLIRYAERPSRRRLAEVVRAYQEFVWKIALRVSGNREDAADIAQDVFLKLLLEPPVPAAIRSSGAYLAWRVLGRARFLRRSRDRQESRERRFAEDIARTELGRDDEADVELVELVRQAIVELSTELRDAVELRYLAGLSPRESAEALGISERALNLRLEKARGELERRLGPVVFSSFAAVTAVESAYAAPPAELSARLLEIADRGAAVRDRSTGFAATAVPSMIGGIIVAKKSAVAIALVIIASLGGFWIVDGSVRDEQPEVERHAAVPEPTTPASEDIETEEPIVAALVPRDEEKAPSEPPRAGIDGRVVDIDGNPVAGAKVECTENMSDEKKALLTQQGYRDLPAEALVLTTESDASGAFSFDGLFPGAAAVRVKSESDGYFQMEGTNPELVAAARHWVEIELDYLKRFYGTLRSVAGVPLAGGLVFFERGDVEIHDPPLVLGHGDYGRHEGVAADDSGGYDTGYRLELVLGPNTHVWAQCWASGHAVTGRSVRSDAFDGNDARVDFELEPELPVTLWIRDPAGNAIEGAEVGLGDATSVHSWFPYPSTRSGANGFARVEHLAPKEHPIRIAKEGFHATGVKVRPGASTDVAVVLRALGEAGIRTRVVFEGDPILRRGNVRVSIEQQHADGSWGGALDPRTQDDRATQTAVYWPREPGRYRFLYRHARDDFETDPIVYTGLEAIEINLVVRLELRAPYVAGIVISEETGEPIANALVEAHWFPEGREPSRWDDDSFLGIGSRRLRFPGFSSPGGCEKTDEQGRFLFLPELESRSTFLLSVRNRPKRIVVPQGSLDAGWSQELALDVGPSSSITDARLVVERGATLEGQVIDGEGNPVANELIVLYDGRSFLDWKTSRVDGSFVFDALRQGRYALEPLGPSRTVRVGAGSGPADLAGLPSPEDFFDRRVAVRDGEVTRVAVDLSRDALGAIEGHIAETARTQGNGIHFGMIVGGRARDGVMTFGGDAEVIDGHFRIEGLFPGRYRLSTVAHTRHDRRLVAAVEVDVVRARTAEVVLDVPRGRLFVPIPSGELGPIGDLRVDTVERLSHVAEDGSEHWDTLGSARVVPAEDGWTVENILPGWIRLHVVAPEYREAWSEGVEVTEDRLARLAPLRLERGIDVLVRLALDNAGDTKDLEFTVYDENRRNENRRIAHTASRGSGAGEWILSAFAPGDYSLYVARGNKTIGQAELVIGPDDERAEVTVTGN
jgi:RNA polymerase sigma factor (sigma-70 family)